MNAADAIIALGKQLSDEKSAAHDLWTWLPSYKVAERNHGDYASEFNARALEHLKGANEAFNDRTREREARGVEGTHKL